jgi:hypothetical protein
MRLLIDTDILIEVLRGNRAVTEELKRLRREGAELLFSPVTKAEIYAGIRSGEEELTALLFASFGPLVIDEEVGELAGRYLGAYGKSHGVQLGNALIGASCVKAGAKLATFDQRHYPMEDIEFFRIKGA